ncbi:ABC transporter substrate-binding protein [Paenibacillus sp. GCM10012307]|uniref:ABC transporter substrate-binding protein n=1 Tax=Paenibacillus roseus TaxID=2798579 RepID=A0A934J744_9BACL|nr:ABC transporter substrate-binding protein [Paenibacillus roseus]MBJ6361597.1 ABC transporter substrate-binding protein [Paenibacillus roseus]
MIHPHNLIRRKIFRTILIPVLATLLLFLQACGQSSSNAGSASSSATASQLDQSGSESTSSAETGQSEAQTKVPEVLNYVFVGVTGKQTGAEGWGFHTGIIPKVLAEHGIKTVNAIGAGTGPDVNEALLSGRADVGSTGDTPAVLTHAAGNKTKVISFYTTSMESYLIGKKNGPKTVKDLEGKTIAVVKGSLMHRYVVGVLEENGVNAKIINMSWADSYAALARGDIDAFAPAAYDYTSYKLVHDEGYPVLDSAKDHPSLLATAVTVATEAYLAKYPDFPNAWAAARTAALEDLKSKPDEYYAFVAEQTKAPIDVVPKLYPIELISDSSISEEGIRRLDEARQFLVKEKLAASDFDLNDWIIK